MVMLELRIRLTILSWTMACAFGVVTRWTNPVIDGANGHGPLVPHVLEGRHGHTGIFVRAEVANAHYFLVYEKVKNMFSLNETTGEITIREGVVELDTETGDDQYVIVIWAKGDEFSVGTATATVMIEDLNDNPPAFQRQLYLVGVDDGIGQGVVIATITATDIDTTEPNNEIIYSISAEAFRVVYFRPADGDEQKSFTMDPLSGVITVRPGKVVSRDVTPVSNLTILATDQGRPPLTGSTRLVVLVAGATGTGRSVVYTSVILPMMSFVM